MTGERQSGWSPGVEDSVPAALARTVAAHPDRIFLDFAGETFTFADVDRASARYARGLQQLGVSRGDRVVAVLDNTIDTVLVALATQRLGAVHVPVNTAYKGEYLRHQIDDCGAAVVIAESDYASRILAVAEGIPQVRNLLFRGDRPAQSANRLSLEALETIGIDGPDLPVDSRPSDLAALMYTAGTTGPSKGCMVSHNYLMYVGRVLEAITDRTPDDLNWTPLPLFHMNAWGSVLSSLVLGATTAVSPRFSVSQFWGEVERTGATIVNLLGTMIPLIAQMDDTPELLRCKGQIRTVVGVPFTPALEKVWKERFGVERVGTPAYGLTEAASMVTSKVGAAKPGTSGRRNRDYDVRIFDEDDHEVPAGVAGEVVCRALQPHIMFDGYWNRPEATQALMRNQWFHTGDIGMFDEDGWFVFVDRKKDYLRRRGENVSSFELEVALLRHEAIAEVAVLAVPSELAEDDIKITVVLRPDAALTEEALCQWAIDNLPYFAVPRYIEFRDALPKNPVGRILKYELREQGVTATTWDREAAGVTFVRR